MNFFIKMHNSFIRNEEISTQTEPQETICTNNKGWIAEKDNIYDSQYEVYIKFYLPWKGLITWKIKFLSSPKVTNLISRYFLKRRKFDIPHIGNFCILCYLFLTICQTINIKSKKFLIERLTSINPYSSTSQSVHLAVQS